MAADASAVRIDDLFACLSLVGVPTEFYGEDGRGPEEQDFPQVLGALLAAVDDLITSRIAGDDREAFAAGYLTAYGANESICGNQAAFAAVVRRLGVSALLLGGYDGSHLVAAITRECTDAAVAFGYIATAGPRDLAVGGEAQDGLLAGIAAMGRAQRGLDVLIADLRVVADEQSDPFPALQAAAGGVAGGPL